jgi:hypothetical protein
VRDGSMRCLAFYDRRPRYGMKIRRRLTCCFEALGHEFDCVVSFAMHHHEGPFTPSAFKYLKKLSVIRDHVVIGHEHFVGQVAFKNVGKLPAIEFVSVGNKIVVRNAEWVTPVLTNAALPRRPPGLVPIGGEVFQGSKGITPQEVAEAQVDGEKYLYVWGRAKFKNGFNRKRYINFCHRYPLERMDPEP